MIVRSLGPNALFYRALTPRWAYLPESGQGVATAGGRFNRNCRGALSAQTTQAGLYEYQAESDLLPPATLATYRVSAESIVDFSAGYNAEH